MREDMPRECHCGRPAQGAPSHYPDVCESWPICEGKIIHLRDLHHYGHGVCGIKGKTTDHDDYTCEECRGVVAKSDRLSLFDQVVADLSDAQREALRVELLRITRE